ncbi:glutamine synthetase family protein [Belnapia sp. F-4-1]|uniref:glutamine synthetase family protein n=1 Tax=Belnapia sp. F-4-1 TaxID=1545443 RepID=UPI0009DF01E1|nr:glutamine synthetase family protein [Belnapia sp. F-4-1]
MRAASRPVAVASPAANGAPAEDGFHRLLAAEGTDTVLVCMVDMQGRLVGKRLTARQARAEAGEAMHACDYLLGVDAEMVPIPGLRASGWERGFGDFSIRPDPATARLLPWQPGTLLVLGDTVDHEGHLVPHAPRSMLRRQLERLAAAGFAASMASELEFTVFQGDWQQLRAGGYRGLTPDGFYSEDYQVFQGTGREPLMRAIRNGMEAAGIPIESSKGEGGPGQAEITLLHAPALESADRHVIYKTGVKEIAQAAGKTASFMAKWHEAQPGSSGHIHVSLWTADGAPASAGPEGLSAEFGHFLAGQIALLREMTLFLAPVVNSYKRFQPGSFAPTKAVWSRDNRTAAFRVLGHGKSLRAECRVPGADVNPYLAYAALIAAGLHGLEQRLPLDPPAEGNAYLAEGLPEIPTTLREAMAALDRSAVLRAAFGDAVIDHYVRAAAWEQSEHDRRVSDWEIARYLERA